MTKVYIIRHAEVEYPVDDQGRRLMYPPETHISEKGRKQSEAFAQILKDKGIRFDAVETSEHTRAQETAEIFSQALGNPAVVPNKAFNDSFRLLMYRLEHLQEEIPSMSLLSKEKYLKRGEAFCVTLNHEGKILETQLLSNLEGKQGEREKY